LWPEWFAAPVADWPQNTALTGFPFFDSASRKPLDGAAQQFIQDGTPPVIATFGSAMKHGQKLFQATVEACKALKQRAILLTPFSEQVPEELPPTIRRFDYLPLSEVLPYAATLVHHGGIGTTSQAMRAGVPQVITPLAHDQFDNAERVKSLRVGTWVPAARVNGSNMARALKQVLHRQEFRTHAAELSRQFENKQPFAHVVEVLEQYGARPPSTKYRV